MKTQMLVKTGAALFALTLALSLGAQTRKTLKVDIPFEFTAGTTTLPAGHYDIRITPGSPVVTLLGAGASANVVSLPDEPSSVTEGATLVFNQYGENCFLAQLKTEDGTRALPPSKVERELQQRAATSPRKEVVIAMR